MKDSMYWKAKREIARKYNASSDVYDALYREEQEEKIKSALEHVQLGKTDMVLDLGCGTGLLFEHIKACAGFLVGLDISRNHLKKTSYRSKDSANIALILADADHMPLIEEFFDKVFAFTLLQNALYVEMTLHEINRVAKKSAHIVVTGLKKAFKKEDFLMLLNKADLEVLNLTVASHLLGHVAVCRRR